MFGRELRSRMDALINEETRKQDIANIKAFMQGEKVYARDFRKSVQQTKWTRTLVTGRLGNIYLVKPQGTEQTWHGRGTKMLKSFGLGISTTDESFDTDFEERCSGLW